MTRTKMGTFRGTLPRDELQMNKKTGTSPVSAAAVDVGGTKIASALFTREGEISAGEKVAIDKAGGDAAAAQVAGRDRQIGRGRPGGTAAGSRPSASAFPASPIPRAAGSGRPTSPAGTSIRCWRRSGDSTGPRPTSPSSSNPTGAPMSPAKPGAARRRAPATPSSWRSGRASARGSSPAAASSTATRTSPAPSAGSASTPTSSRSMRPWARSRPRPRGIPWPARPGRALEQGRPSAMLDLAGGDIAAVTAETVAAAARARDPLALEIVAGRRDLPGHGRRQYRQPPQSRGGRPRRRPLPGRRHLPRAGPPRVQALGPAAGRRVRSGSRRSALGEDAGLYGCGRLAWDDRRT